MGKTIKVINNKDRFFNGARKGQIIEIDSTRLNTYLLNGFSLVKEVEEKQNIVKAPVTPTKTKAELIAILEHVGVTADPKLKVAELEALVKEVEEKQNTISQGVVKINDIEAIKKQLIDDKIVTEDELTGKNDEEIKQLAKDNGFTDLN